MDPIASKALADYRPPIVGFDCARCRRHATVNVEDLQKRFGPMVPLGEAARRVAAIRGCALAQDGSEVRCGVRVVAPPVHHWANLDDALGGGWLAVLNCQRHMVSMKRTAPCAEPVALDVETLLAVLGWEVSLEVGRGALDSARPEGATRGSSGFATSLACEAETHEAGAWTEELKGGGGWRWGGSEERTN